MKNIVIVMFIGVLLVGITGCKTSRPEFTPVKQTLEQSMKNPMVPTSMARPLAPKRSPGSLWVAGDDHFFKDSRARKVGDIVTVVVTEKAKAEFEANTQADRKSTQGSGITNLLNMEGWLTNRGIAPGVSSLLDMESDRKFSGKGITDREDTLEARIAAVVVQVLPNGYLAIHGKREVMVNYEMQELNIQGIIRPTDISSDNTIVSEKIAEARISYTGRGIMDDSQAPQYGESFVNKWMPF